MPVRLLLSLIAPPTVTRGLRFAIVLAFATSGSCAVSVPGRADDAAVARAVLTQSRYQTTLPDAGTASLGLDGKAAAAGQKDHSNTDQGQTQPADGTRTDSRTPPQSEPAVPPQSVDVAASATARAVLHLLQILLVVGLVAALAYFGIKAYQRRQRPIAPQELPAVVPSHTVTESQPSSPERLPEWQNLANQGRFTEAIHVLLLQLLREMRRDNLIDLSASLTSREILQAPDLPTHRRAGLGTVVGAVEFCHFGGRPAGLQLYERCLDAYRRAIPVTPSHAANE